MFGWISHNFVLNLVVLILIYAAELKRSRLVLHGMPRWVDLLALDLAHHLMAGLMLFAAETLKPTPPTWPGAGPPSQCDSIAPNISSISCTNFIAATNSSSNPSHGGGKRAPYGGPIGGGESYVGAHLGSLRRRQIVPHTGVVMRVGQPP